MFEIKGDRINDQNNDSNFLAVKDKQYGSCATIWYGGLEHLKTEQEATELAEIVVQFLTAKQEGKKFRAVVYQPCDKSCSPSDFHEGGKCDTNGCWEPEPTMST